ncbi:MAG: hypothetical protein HYY24_19595 [Verrucomicrobia bacterium]|nr:hypothetical protein [Verrucomicrobiota bacterium]
MSEQLQTALQSYRRHLPDLLAEQGKFALLAGDELVGVFGTYEDALTIGYEKFGLKTFLVKQILAEDEVLIFTRDLGESCPT